MMRPNDRDHGSLRMLLIFILLAANIVAALAHHAGSSAPARTAPRVMARPTVENPSGRVAFGNGLSTGQESSTALKP